MHYDESKHRVESEVSNSCKILPEVNYSEFKKIVLAQILRIFSDALTFHACTQQQFPWKEGKY